MVGVVPFLTSVLDRKCLLLGVHVHQQISDTVAVAELVIIPGNELHEVVVQGDASTSIKDGGVGVTDEVRGHHLVLGVTQHSLHGPM